MFIWEGSNYASLAVSFSCIVNKITGEDTEAEDQKYFFRKSFGNITGKTPVLEFLFKKVAGPWPYNFIKKATPTLTQICEIFKSNFFYRRSLVAAFKISNSNNPTICSKIFYQYPLRTRNI